MSEHKAKFGPLAVLHYVDVCVCVPVRIVCVRIVHV